MITSPESAFFISSPTCSIPGLHLLQLNLQNTRTSCGHDTNAIKCNIVEDAVFALGYEMVIL